MDDGPHGRTHPPRVRDPVPPRSHRSVAAQPGVERAEPERRALERDEEAIARWKRKDWPRIKNAARLGAHLVFADESGFMLIPNLVRTWAPAGQTPIHRHRQGRRDKISVISGISLSPRRHRLSLYYLLF